jgi:hypothetical protein
MKDGEGPHDYYKKDNDYYGRIAFLHDIPFVITGNLVARWPSVHYI